VVKVCEIPIDGKAVLAPMAGVTDRVFRGIAKTHGAALVFTELVSADGLVRCSPRTEDYLRFSDGERPIGIQLYGSDPGVMAEAARCVEAFQPDLIDLNFGCPVRKVIKRGAGAALMKDLDRMKAIARAVTKAVSTPVSAKIRSGWCASQIVAVEAARVLEDAGVCMVTLHARTQKMGFSGMADWDLIRRVKEAMSVPVVGNGDVRGPQDASRMLEETGCDLVMIGRGALGRPWIFQRIRGFLESGEDVGDPPFPERIDVCLAHFEAALGAFGTHRAVREMRKHIGWYLRGMPGNHRVRQAIYSMTHPEEVLEQLRAYATTLCSLS
jgi:tRNA-dihydrouridine synthase B